MCGQKIATEGRRGRKGKKVVARREMKCYLYAVGRGEGSAVCVGGTKKKLAEEKLARIEHVKETEKKSNTLDGT